VDIINLIVNLISGAIGGNLAAAFLKDQSLGTLGNSVAGILGGGIGAAILQALGAFTGAGGLDVGSLIASILSGVVGGAIVMAIIGLIRSPPAKI
jgi:uncharacterized membrane protein YeaQ/YmgE (transglycosylase-associated protein family)